VKAKSYSLKVKNALRISVELKKEVMHLVSMDKEEVEDYLITAFK
jgi:hypothetical protein